MAKNTVPKLVANYSILLDGKTYHSQPIEDNTIPPRL